MPRASAHSPPSDFEQILRSSEKRSARHAFSTAYEADALLAAHRSSSAICSSTMLVGSAPNNSAGWGRRRAPPALASDGVVDDQILIASLVAT